MKLNPIFALILIGCLSLSCLAWAQATEQDLEEDLKRDSSVAPKLFDFAKFKTIFKKQYSSTLEELARKKIFLSRAFKSFLSFVGFKNFKSTSYLKVNEFSDWTQDEIDSLYYKRASQKLADPEVVTIKPEVVGEPTEGSKAEQIAVGIEEIDEKLKEIMELGKNEPGYAELASELAKAKESTGRRRRRRDVGSRDDLSILDVMTGELPPEEEKSVLFAEKIPSNNPDYESPELTSYGADEEEDATPLSSVQSALIAGMRGANFLTNILSSAASSLVGLKEPKKPVVDEVYVDHRRSNCLMPVKNQRNCGSCYIFSTTALFEWQHCMETGTLTGFSEQYALDCGKRVGLRGCKGGLETDVARFNWLFGVELAANYPYRRRSDSCPYDANLAPSRMGYLRVKEPSLRPIAHYKFERVIKERPILIGMGVSEDFHSYGGGVDKAENCSPERGHSMLIVGHGNEDGVEYWLMRNSYGPSWGLKGYYKFAKSSAWNCMFDWGQGYVLDPIPGEKVFGHVNSLNDGSAVQKHVDKHKNVIKNFLTDLFESQETESGLATPKSF